MYIQQLKFPNDQTDNTYVLECSISIYVTCANFYSNVWLSNSVDTMQKNRADRETLDKVITFKVTMISSVDK